jgi:hypothetical protein
MANAITQSLFVNLSAGRVFAAVRDVIEEQSCRKWPETVM